MKYALLHTKLNRPSVAPDIVPRDRLIKLLDQGRKRPLTLISAPAGYGKSTLASQWLAAIDMKSSWYSIDPAELGLEVLGERFDRARLRETR